jgi:hypothetical protein
VFPWWYLGAAVVTLLLVAVLPWLHGSGVVAAFWGPLIGSVIRDRRMDERVLSAKGEPADRRAVRGRTWWEPATAFAFILVSIGVALIAGNLWPVVRPAQLVVGAGVLLLSIAFFAVLLLVSRLRRRRSQAGCS